MWRRALLAGVGHFSGSIFASDFVNGALAKHDVGLGIYGGGGPNIGVYVC